MRWRGGSAHRVPTQASRAAAPPVLGGVAEVLTGPAGQRLAGADPGLAHAPHPLVPVAPHPRGGCQGRRDAFYVVLNGNEVFRIII